MKTKIDLTHDQFKSPLDGSWQFIFSSDAKWMASHVNDWNYVFKLAKRSKRGLLNTLHRMNIQTRKAK